MKKSGKQRSLDALNGIFSEQVPVGLFTWDFGYYWKVANLLPWQLSAGSIEMWHQAHTSLFYRHHPDVLWYSGSGAGDREPSLMQEDGKIWRFKDNNTGNVYVMTKDSYSVMEIETGKKSCDSVGVIDSRDDAIKLIPEFKGWGDLYLSGLNRLVSEVMQKALVLPHHSPAYICACYAFGFEKAMEKMAVEPELFIYVCDRYAAGDELRMQQLADAGAEAVFVADGWASCDIISPDMVRKFAIPYQKSIIGAAHKAGLKVILWNEGDILPILDQEADLEMDGFAFEQPRKGIELTVSKVRQVFGNKRCLLGNLDSELLLLRNDCDEITQSVNAMIRQSGKGSPFIMSTGSPVASDIPVEAVETMINAIRKFSWDN